MWCHETGDEIKECKRKIVASWLNCCFHGIFQVLSVRTYTHRLIWKPPWDFRLATSHCPHILRHMVVFVKCLCDTSAMIQHEFFGPCNSPCCKKLRQDSVQATHSKHGGIHGTLGQKSREEIRGEGEKWLCVYFSRTCNHSGMWAPKWFYAVRASGSTREFRSLDRDAASEHCVSLSCWCYSVRTFGQITSAKNPCWRGVREMRCAWW